MRDDRPRRRATALARVSLGFLTALWAGTATAQQLPAPPPVPDEPGGQEPPLEQLPAGEETKTLDEPVGPSPGASTLDLASSVRAALEHNFGLLSAGDSVQAARFRESAAKGQFYPKLTPRYLVTPDDKSLLIDASQRLPWSGAILTASTTLRSTELTADPLSHTADLRLILTQPLLRGFGPNATYFDLRNSRRGVEAQARSYALARQRLAVQVAAAFYNVVAQRQLLAVSRQSLRRGENLRKASEARLKVGLVSKLDVFRADLQASQTQEALVRSEAGLETALEQFRGLLGLPVSDNVEPEAVILPETVEQETEPLEILVGRALENRIELREARDQVDDARRSASLARQNLLPQLDVNLGLSRSGFGPTYHDALRSTDTKLDAYFTTSYPIERSAEQAGRAVAELEVQGRERAVRQRQIDIESEVRASARELERIRKSIELQRKGVEVADQQLRLATLRYQRGLASNFDVVDAEGSLVLARSALVGLVTSYRVAQMDLRRVTGTLDVDREFGMPEEPPPGMALEISQP
jgi:outer membrane protein TolC